MKKRIASIAAIGLAASALLAACGGSSESTTPSASPTPSALPSLAPLPSPEPTIAPELPMVGGDPATWTPVSITMDMNGTNLVLVKGQAAVFTDLPANDATNVIVVRAKPKGVVKVSQQRTEGDAQFNAGLTALKKGKTTVTVYDGDPKSDTAIVVMQFTVQVKKATKANIEKAANALMESATGVTATQE
jgi:hypothetical protein